jgi:hypothetical protein
MLLIQCNGCGASVTTQDGSDPDAQLNCCPDSDCCLQDHHHGQQADATGEPCRPITITVLGAAVGPAGGLN